MKKILDYILLFCLLLIVLSSVMFVMAEHQPRSWVQANKEFINNLVNSEPEDVTRGGTRYSALILSFNQNEKPDTFGPKKSRFRYDFEGRGLAVRTGWASPKAGLLVTTRGGAPKLVGYDGSNTAGFEFLAANDANGDGRIDERDAIWSELKVWMDKNSNGRIEEAIELFSLPDLKITALDLHPKDENRYLIDGNYIMAAGAFEYGGQSGRLDEIFLRQHSHNTKFLTPIKVSSEIAALVPDIPGSGLVRKLREAAMLNPELISLVAKLKNAPDDEQRWAGLDEVAAAWTETAEWGETRDERYGTRYRLLSDGLETPEGVELARKLDILDAWAGRRNYLLPHELNPVQQINEQMMRYNPETEELAVDYLSMKEIIDDAYYRMTNDLFKKFFPGSESLRPGTEHLFRTNKAGPQESAR